MEDTLIALNTGYWRLRDGTLIERGKGKSCIVNPEWRKKLDQIAKIIEGIRKRFQNAMGLDQMFYHYRRRPGQFRDYDAEDRMEFFRNDRGLGKWMNAERERERKSLIVSFRQACVKC